MKYVYYGNMASLYWYTCRKMSYKQFNKVQMYNEYYWPMGIFTGWADIMIGVP